MYDLDWRVASGDEKDPNDIGSAGWRHLISSRCVSLQIGGRCSGGVVALDERLAYESHPTDGRLVSGKGEAI